MSSSPIRKENGHQMPYAKNTVIRRSLVDQVYSLIIEKIQQGELKAGDRLNIEDLSKEFGVSRTPMREAISRLAQNGFVEVIHNAGPRVIGFSADRIHDLCIANTILMDGMADLIIDNVNVSPDTADEISELRQIIEKQQKAFDDDDDQLFYQLSIRFHEILMQLCPNTILRSYAINSQIQLDAFVASYQRDSIARQSSIDEHTAILQALEARDIEGFRKALHDHNIRPAEYFEAQTD